MAIFTNQATLTYSGGVLTSNTAVGEIVEVLSMTKTAINDGYGIGDTVTYVISIVNSGAQTFTGLAVTDDLGAFSLNAGTVTPLTYVEDSLRYFINGVPQAVAPAVVAGPPLQIGGFSVPAGGNVILIYETTVNQFAPPTSGEVITNTATLTGGGLATPITAEETVPAAQAAQLNIFKALSPATVTENGTLTYTFLIENSGNTAAIATDDVVVTDLFSPILENITVTLDGVVLTEGVQYNYNQATGLFQTVAGNITVPPATFTQDPVTGQWTVVPGIATLVVTGTI
jgi:uncharacterized repeat protein (TIGR01451 family)